jgi:hypothetical protein
MKKHRILLSTILLVLALGVLTPQFAQDTPTIPTAPDLERRAHAIGLIRAINTVEVTERSIYGSYASWQTLLMHYPEYLNECLAKIYPQEVNLRFADMPEILPKYGLRLNVRADGQGYDVRLKDMEDKQGGWAAFSDENGVIWQGEPLH